MGPVGPESSFLAVGDSQATSDAAVEEELGRVGRALFAAFPKKGLNPVKALDAKAMELASQDAELRAALFRFVDVTPACRSLDDLARHLTGYLDEVDERPPSLDVGDADGGEQAGPAPRWAPPRRRGVRHMAHRFIVGESRRSRRSASCASCGTTASPPRSTCSARRR